MTTPAATVESSSRLEEDFYLRFHVGQKNDRSEEESLEFELLPDGKLRYSNSSSTGQYRTNNDSIEREFHVGIAIVEEIKRMVREAAIVDFDDAQWPPPFHNGGGIQEIEVKIDCHHVSFATTEIGATSNTRSDSGSYLSNCDNKLPSTDDGGLAEFYQFGYDLRSLVMTLMACHFKQRPFGR